MQKNIEEMQKEEKAEDIGSFSEVVKDYKGQEWEKIEITVGCSVSKMIAAGNRGGV